MAKDRPTTLGPTGGPGGRLRIRLTITSTFLRWRDTLKRGEFEIALVFQRSLTSVKPPRADVGEGAGNSII